MRWTLNLNQTPRKDVFKMAGKVLRFIILLVIFCTNTKCNAKSACSCNKVLNKLAVANNELGIKLHHQLTEDTPENVFFSPISLSTAFGMLFLGTRGNSAAQLRNVLGYKTAKLSNNKVPTAFKRYLAEILQGNEQGDNAYILNLANEILLSELIDINSDYERNVENFFQAYVENVDFARNTGAIIKQVNKWVSQQTHGKIKQFLTELSPSTVFVILNAVYFKGTWQTQFDKKLTSVGKFYNLGRESKDVPFMHIKEKYPYFSNADYQIVELPYKGKDISLIILLPTVRNGLQEIEEKLTAVDIKNFQEQLTNTTINLSIPKFKLEYSRELSSDFKSLGATDIFNSGLADFSGLTASKGLSVSQVIHKAVIEINEEGSEAAAATGISGVRFLSPSFVANHPFLFMIVDKRNSLVLFLGHVTSL